MQKKQDDRGIGSCGLEIEVPGNAEFRRRFKYRLILCPHITTSHLWKNIYHEVLEPAVFKHTGLIDEYRIFKPRVDKIGQDKTGQDKTGQGKTVHRQWLVKVNKGSRAPGVRG